MRSVQLFIVTGLLAAELCTVCNSFLINYADAGKCKLQDTFQCTGLVRSYNSYSSYSFTKPLNCDDVTVVLYDRYRDYITSCCVGRLEFSLDCISRWRNYECEKNSTTRSHDLKFYFSERETDNEKFVGTSFPQLDSWDRPGGGFQINCDSDVEAIRRKTSSLSQLTIYGLSIGLSLSLVVIVLSLLCFCCGGYEKNCAKRPCHIRRKFCPIHCNDDDYRTITQSYADSSTRERRDRLIVTDTPYQPASSSEAESPTSGKLEDCNDTATQQKPASCSYSLDNEYASFREWKTKPKIYIPGSYYKTKTRESTSKV